MNTIAQNGPHIIRLKSFVEPQDILTRHGYVIQPLTDEELLLKRRCLGCGKALSRCIPKKNNHSRCLTPTHATDETLTAIVLPTSSIDKPASASGFRCKYHPDKITQKRWTCCGQHMSAKPCSGSHTHCPRMYAAGELDKLYQFHPTPDILHYSSDIREAVALDALDCEMGTAVSGDSDLIRITVIDYFTCELLLNNIVEPSVPMQHLNTRFSGVTWADVRNAKRLGSCFKAKEEARRALWRYVGPEIVVVGHGASNDLRALRWIHQLVMDSMLTEYLARTGSQLLQRASFSIKKQEDKDAVFVPTKKAKKLRQNSARQFSLKTLTKKRLDRDIQISGKLGHDSLEDATAARDLVHWIVAHPEELQ
ncbi:ribonuclease H-like domain-containing protein [Dendryphion nanum]|uniref:Ribonuclease H-like domain-containing protein n=1 Tax=Dendryphion nanum TaxID=256645 RepID=A0A9P9D2Z1_9PLEO|nr:ribonuclease H-like domain-containing protein [Dendryphion nanum]